MTQSAPMAATSTAIGRSDMDCAALMNGYASSAKTSPDRPMPNITVQTAAPCVEYMLGPGLMFTRFSAANMIAAAALPGMPSASSGMMVPTSHELLALSAPRMPSRLPSPKRSGRRVRLRATE
jgi:hypothetical protein